CDGLIWSRRFVFRDVARSTFSDAPRSARSREFFHCAGRALIGVSDARFPYLDATAVTLDHDVHQLAEANAALSDQNRELFSHVASLHDQISRLQDNAASDREQYHRAIADYDYYRQRWEELEDERVSLDDALHMADLTNADLNLQIDSLRHSSAASYRALQEELWAEQDVVRHLHRSQSQGPPSIEVEPPRLRDSASRTSSTAASTSPATFAAGSRTPGSPVSSTPFDTHPDAVLIQSLRHQLTQAQDAERRARTAAGQTSSRREAAERVAFNAERLVTALRGEITTAVARGDGYKTSFNSTLEQRKTDNAHNAQRYSILESQLTESIAESDSLRDIVTQHEATIADLTSQAEAAAAEITQLRGQLQAVLDDSELQRVDDADTLEVVAAERDLAITDRDSALQQVTEMTDELAAMTIQRDLLEQRMRAARDTLFSGLGASGGSPTGIPALTRSTSDTVATHPGATSTSRAAPASAPSVAGSRPSGYSASVPLAPSLRSIDPSLGYRYPRMGERYFERRPRSQAIKPPAAPASRHRSPSPLGSTSAPLPKRRKGSDPSAGPAGAPAVSAAPSGGEESVSEEKDATVHSGVAAPRSPPSRPSSSSGASAARRSLTTSLAASSVTSQPRSRQSTPSLALASPGNSSPVASQASSATERSAARRRASAAGAAPGGGGGGSSPSSSSSDDASGSDGEGDYGVVAGPVTDVEDDPTPTTPVGYTLVSIDPFFDPCLPPRIDSAEWDTHLDAYPWDKVQLGRYALRGTTIDELKTLFPPPSSWIHPARTGQRLPSFNARLITVENLLQAYRVHLSKWAQSYWESTHALPLRIRSEQYFVDLIADISARRSRARVNFDRTVLKVVRRLMQNGRCDLDVLLDPIFLTFPPPRQRTPWRPTGAVDPQGDLSLIRALRILDDAEPWRLFYRREPQSHPAAGARLQRLSEKFVEQL
ncbi:hypothetical protein BBJ28_00023217, partial [Nothophytophthora sp. Chile5]